MAIIVRALERDKNPRARVPVRYTFVELAGVEPASKQGILVLSTRLSWPSFSSGGKTQATNRRLICFVFEAASQPATSILCISAPLYPFSPQTRLGVTSRSGALRPNRLIYYTSIKQREHKKCCQLCFEARLTSIASLLGVLTQPFYLLSKPDSPGGVPVKRGNRPPPEGARHPLSQKACKSTAFF